MELKLRARLSAYSKVDSIGSNSLPDPSTGNVGDVLGVGSSGGYELVPTVTTSDIDELFAETDSKATSITKDEIDSLFDDTTVSLAQIDSLFS